MERNTQQKKTKAPKRDSQTTTPTTETPQHVGGFQVGEIAGQLTVRNGDARVVLSFEFSAPIDETVDVVIGPIHWEPGAEVFEVRGVPVIANAAIVEIERSDLERIAQDGRVSLYGRMQNGQYINRDGRPFENFQLTL